MLKTMIAGLAAASLVLVTPAQAARIDGDEIGKLVFGIAVVAAVNSILDNRRADQAEATEVHHNRWQDPTPRRNNANRWSDLNQRTNSRVIPHECMRRVETRFGIQRMFGRRCLERNYTFVNSLPDRCAVRVYTDHGPRRGFDPLCLREQGYRSDRRR